MQVIGKYYIVDIFKIMGLNFDINKGFQNKSSRKQVNFTLVVILTSFVVLVVLFVVQTMQGKHVKTPIIETNIPQKSRSISDSSKSHTEININENHGDIIVNPTINNQTKK